MLVRQPVVEARQVLEAHAARTRRSRCDACAASVVEVLRVPSRATRSGSRARQAPRRPASCAARPRRRTRTASPSSLPLCAEVVRVTDSRQAVRRSRRRRADATTSTQRGVADDQPRVVRLVAEPRDVGQLRIAGDERRPRVPHVLEQQLEQRDARHRAAADDAPAVRRAPAPGACENSITLRTGPSQEIARSGSSR